MLRKVSFLFLVFVLSLAIALPAFAAGPSFAPAIYADGKLFSTIGLTELPAPDAINVDSFDKLFMFSNSNNPNQKPVSEAGPGNPNYNGGRWFAHTVVWDAGYLAMVGTAPLITSYAELAMHHSAGHLDVTPGAISGPTYFECPLLPVK